MNRKAFHQLLKRYLENNCTAEERQLIDQWYELLDDESRVSLAGNELNTIEDRLWNSISAKTTEKEIPAPVQRTGVPWWKFAAAAVFTGLTMLAVYFVFTQKDKHNPTASLVNEKAKQGLLKETNNTNTIRTIILEDSSVIRLQPGASIAWPTHFAADKREIYLDGEAWFNAAKNVNRPFYVYNDQLVTQVLGTSFTIKNAKDLVEVAVHTGKVAVYENNHPAKADKKNRIETNGVIITPNQKVIYYSESRHFVTALVDAPVPVAEENKPGQKLVFVFNDTPLSEVLNTLEKIYHIEIVLENEQVKNCSFTGDITTEPLFDKLEMICQVFGATYEVQGTKILFKGGKGCQ